MYSFTTSQATSTKLNDFEVDYESDENAHIVYSALAVDKELQPDKVKRQMSVSNGKLCVIDLVCLLEGGEFLLSRDEEQLVVYNSKDETSRDMVVCGIPGSFTSGSTYVESLISLERIHGIGRQCEACKRMKRTYYAEIAHNVSTQKRKEIVEHVAQLYIVVTNKLARCSARLH
ncbi:hypothetical protein LOK49_LG12G02710 [Camellia lanceoleosa]|uniref:Uncharacterized protein n=1 Tax=Camellia lanceoleosa TaxID=1840588 RepID=A0ACC0FRT8_9ERIC|nr:hypothetical protein LOK49_LG12G02710 [Camellia lanceoleosa]